MNPRMWFPLVVTGVCLIAVPPSTTADEPRASKGIEVTDSDEMIRLVTPSLEASIRKQGYITGIAAGSFLDVKTGFRDPGFGLDIIDWIMEPGSDEAYRDQLDDDLPYNLEERFHGKARKRCVEGPQMCHGGTVAPEVIRGEDFVAVKTVKAYTTAAPGKKTGSTWTQTLVFPEGRRYFLSSDRMDCVNSGEELFFRMDMPGHIKHKRGDTFSEVYLSYHGIIPASEFLEEFAPDAKYLYKRGMNPLPERFIRAYHLRDPVTGKAGPWLAGMTLNPSDVSEAWCHQRGYVCFIQENGGRPIRPGESIEAAFVVGYFDSIAEMEEVYDRYAGHSRLAVDRDGWMLK
ncbi:hypothetical protein P12x_000721 [Tundrisphaera lichenicola]|uniref:hypothetical protein n=1 Tax=Tundrisphaera lichenicola TaxID=2029860 RepID=UPI003EBC4A88